jgi:hypothetical protein
MLLRYWLSLSHIIRLNGVRGTTVCKYNECPALTKGFHYKKETPFILLESFRTCWEIEGIIKYCDWLC